jgi:hypothetical protein
LATRRVVCPECAGTVPYGRLSCPTCGTLLASVAGSALRVAPRPVGRRGRGVAATRADASGGQGQDGASQVEGSDPEAPPPEHGPGLRVPRIRLRRHREPSNAEQPAETAQLAAVVAAEGPSNGGRNGGPSTGRSSDDAGPPAPVHRAPTPRSPAKAILLNGRPHADTAPPVLQDWVGPVPSTATPEPVVTVPTVPTAPTAPTSATAGTSSLADYRRPLVAMTSAFPAAAAAGAVSARPPSLAPSAGAAIAGSYLAPSATQHVPLSPGTRPTESPRVASVPATPGPNRWYSVADGTPPAPLVAAAARATPTASRPTFTAVNAPVAPTGPATSAASAHMATPEAGRAGLFSDLPFRSPDSASGWATAAGSGLAALAFVLPWARDGVAGTQHDLGYLGQWGLANPAYVLLILAALATLLFTILPNQLPRAFWAVALPLVLGGIFVGMAWDYATGPFGTGLGLDLMFVGAMLLVVGGALGLRDRGGTSAGDDTPA